MAAKGKKPKKTGSKSTGRSTADRRLQAMVMAAVEKLDEAFLRERLPEWTWLLE